MRLTQRTIKTTIIVLSVLLGLSLAALGGMMIYRHASLTKPVSVVVPDNIITPEHGDEKGDSAGHNAEDSDQTSFKWPGSAENAKLSCKAATISTVSLNSYAQFAEMQSSAKPAVAPDSVKLTLYSNQPEDNTPFEVRNMFPGDAETKYFCVVVSHDQDVTVKYHADIHEGYEKLAEVLKCRVVLITTGETLYDGLMRDMPEAIEHRVTTTEKTDTELYYEITGYLDTSVGNDYQEKTLIANFRWWVDEEGLVPPPPSTGQGHSIWFYGIIAAIGVYIVAFVIVKCRKGGHKNG